MARTYAGILGLLAFLTCVARGLIQGGGPVGVLGTACLTMAAFAVVGSLVGWIAQQTVEESVRGRVAAEVAAEAAAEQSASAPARTASAPAAQS